MVILGETKDDKSILSHSLVPKHRILSKEEEEKFLAKFKVAKRNLPKILLDDPIVAVLGALEGNILEIKRVDPTKENVYYRVVVR